MTSSIYYYFRNYDIVNIHSSEETVRTISEIRKFSDSTADKSPESGVKPDILKAFSLVNLYNTLYSEEITGLFKDNFKIDEVSKIGDISIYFLKLIKNRV